MSKESSNKTQDNEDIWIHMYPKVGKPKYEIGDKVKDIIHNRIFTIDNIIPMAQFGCWGYALEGGTLYVAETDLKLMEKSNENE